jgi:hypothetical protein
MQRDGKPWSVADEYRVNGITLIKPFAEGGTREEGIGINLVKQRLKEKSLFVHESCRNTINEFIKYRWRNLRAQQKDLQNVPEAPVDRDNHAMDCVRYACSWRPPGSPRPEPPVIMNTLHYWILKNKKAVNDLGFAGWN